MNDRERRGKVKAGQRVTRSQTAKLVRFNAKRGDAKCIQDPENEDTISWIENDKRGQLREKKIILTRDKMASGRDEKQQKGSYGYTKDELKLGCLLKNLMSRRKKTANIELHEAHNYMFI